MVLITSLGTAAPDQGLVARNAQQDCGTLRAGPLLVRDFTLYNPGPSTIRITKATGGCGCVRTAIGQQELAPGAETIVRVEVNTLTPAEGMNTWHVTVEYTRDQQDATPQATGLPAPVLTVTQTLELSLQARLVREITVTPPSVAISSTDAVQQTITITDRRPTPLKIKTVACTHALFKVTVGQPASANGETTVPISLDIPAEIPAGEHREHVIILTEDPAYPELRIPVQVTKRSSSNLRVSPDSLVIRLAPGQSRGSILATLRNPSGMVHIEKVVCDHPGIQVKWSEAPGPVATIRITSTATESGAAMLQVHLADPKGESLNLPVRWEKE